MVLEEIQLAHRKDSVLESGRTRGRDAANDITAYNQVRVWGCGYLASSLAEEDLPPELYEEGQLVLVINNRSELAGCLGTIAHRHTDPDGFEIEVS